MRAAAEIVERRGARFIEASFTGSKPAAEKGELVYYVGATDAAFQEARPILEASSKEIVYIGTIGQASAIKIATNMITAASVQAAAEALALVQALGLPPEKFVEAMRANASQSATLTMKVPKMLERDFGPQFSVKHMLKDMQLASQIALSHYLDLGVTAAARNQLFEQMQWGHGDDDYSSVVRKYLNEPAPASYEEPPSEEQGGQPDANEPGVSSEESEAETRVEVAELTASPQPVLAFGERVSTAAPADTPAPLRRGFLKQLLSKLSSGKE
jgi:hypothetical protein